MKYARLLSIIYSVIMPVLMYASRKGEGFSLPLLISFPGGLMLLTLCDGLFSSFFRTEPGEPRSPNLEFAWGWLGVGALFIGGFIQYYLIGRLIDFYVKLKPKDEPLYKMPDDWRDPK
ncbi:MAG: hypothetical protein HOP19_05745 [Acidobacteria bacterium]|nr:hypothetical protein [Acidobacteriota bacterium]